MPLLNPFELPRPVSPGEETRTFTDPKQPGKELTLTFSTDSDYSTTLTSQVLAATYAKTKLGPMAFPIKYGDRLINITPELCGVIALLETMQKPDETGAKYSFDQWAVLNVAMPSAMAQIAEWAYELIDQSDGAETQDGEVTVPKDSAASSGTV
jgi:hypothetical protein